MIFVDDDKFDCDGDDSGANDAHEDHVSDDATCDDDDDDDDDDVYDYVTVQDDGEDQ